MSIIQFENGVKVRFDGNPTPKDVEEVANRLKINQPKQSVDQMATQSSEVPEQKDGFLKSLIKEPIKTLIVRPAVRTGQALGSLGVFGKRVQEGVQKQMDEGKSTEIDFTIPGTNFGFGKYTIEPVKSGTAGVKQAVGEGLESASYLVGGGATKAASVPLRSTFGTAVKTGATIGAKSGALYGTGSALQEDRDVAGVAGQALGGAVTGGLVGGVLGGVTSKIAQRTARTAEQTQLLKEQAPDTRVATKTLTEEGRVITDKPAKEAVRQGIPEADVALIKTSSPADKAKMSKMLKVRQSQLTNKRITERATDVVGDTFVEKLAKPIEKLNKSAAQKLDVVAQGLAGQKVDASPAITSFANNLDKSGVTIVSRGRLNFKNSDFEGLKSIQSLIQNVWKRATKVARSGDALQAHRMKRYIDEIVNYGKEVEGLSGRAQTMLKQLRHDVDGVLDSTFNSYNKVNTVYADTINELNKMGVVLGKSFRIGDTFADAQAGLSMRRILSNTKSRAEILRLLDDMQKVAKKYGVKIDEDIVTQANFADLLEKMLGSEAPTSFLGQIERGVEGIGSAGADLARGKFIRGTLKAGKYVLDVTRGINEENRINALHALLSGEKKSNFGISTISKELKGVTKKSNFGKNR